MVTVNFNKHHSDNDQSNAAKIPQWSVASHTLATTMMDTNGMRKLSKLKDVWKCISKAM